MTKPTAMVLDVVCVIVFAIIGRSSHHEALDLGGIATTAWPFLLGCLAGWVIIHTMLRRLPLLSQGAVIAADTILFGLLFRLAAGQGVSWPFPLIAAIALLVLLLGWRLVAWFVLRTDRRRRPR